MKMDSAETLAPAAASASVSGLASALGSMASSASGTVATDVYRELGAITRLLHDTLNQLGVMPSLQIAAENLPDARSRLSYIANKTADAANKVLNLVDQAKTEHLAISSAANSMAGAIAADPVKALASGAVFNFVQDVESRTARIDAHLTDIMMAQDFHDLTGQVVAKVITLASELEANLVKLLIKAVPDDQREIVDTKALSGPVVNPEGRTDVVSNQGEVDDLLASLGF
jgi:chemotaxis protein CheZ